MNKAIKATLITLACVVLAILLFIAICFAEAYIHILFVKSDQADRLNNLRKDYLAGKIAPVDEQQFCDFDIAEAVEGGYKLTDLQFVGTHNSYKLEKNAFERMFAEIATPLKEGNYSYETLTGQLNAGIRSLELDLFYHKSHGKTKFNCFHIGGLDMTSSAFDMELALEELDLWSKNNPGHMPITVLLEVKSTGAVLAPYKYVGVEQLKEFDKLLKQTVSTLYTPQEAYEGYGSLSAMREAGKPTIADTLGKIMFILHPGDLVSDYVQYDPTFTQQAMFPAINDIHDESAGDQRFVYADTKTRYWYDRDDNVEFYQNMLVRVTIDDFLKPMPTGDELAFRLSGNSVICTTNRIPRTDIEVADALYLSDGSKTIHLRR